MYVRPGCFIICPQPAWVHLNRPLLPPPPRLPLVLGAVMLQDVRVFLPELLCYDVAVVLLHPPSAAGHRHVLLLLTGKFGPFGDCFLLLGVRKRGHDKVSRSRSARWRVIHTQKYVLNIYHYVTQNEFHYLTLFDETCVKTELRGRKLHYICIYSLN